MRADFVDMQRGTYGASEEQYTESLRICRASGAAWGIAWSLYAPAFEVEEAAFWATHELSDELLAQIPDAVLPRPRTKPIPVRFDQDTVRRLKVLAAKRHKGYQTLLKEFVVERLYEEEKREGLISFGGMHPVPHVNARDRRARAAVAKTCHDAGDRTAAGLSTGRRTSSDAR